jgi:hypothetical protein
MPILILSKPIASDRPLFRPSVFGFLIQCMRGIRRDLLLFSEFADGRACFVVCGGRMLIATVIML